MGRSFPCRSRPCHTIIRWRRSASPAGCSASCRKEVTGMALAVCAYCGKKIRRKPSQIKRNVACFCSRGCCNEAMKKGGNVSCGWCWRIFYKPPSKMQENNFCSAECRNGWLGKRNREVMNVKGHSKGHKAPHLSELNQRRNPLGRIAENRVEVPSPIPQDSGGNARAEVAPGRSGSPY